MSKIEQTTTNNEDIPSEIRELASNIAQNENLVNFTVKKVGGSGKGEGYGSNIIFLEITEDKKNQEEKKTLNLIAKISIKNEAYRKDIPVSNIFYREIFMYTKVFPLFKIFQDECKIQDKFTSTTKCFATCTEHEMIILQNLKTLNYKCWDRKKPMDEEHIKLVLKEYGKLHAISFALKEKNKPKFDELTSQCEKDALLDCIDIMLNTYHQHIEACYKLFDREKEAEYIQALIDYKNNFKDFMILAGTHSDEYSVITHGDCWCNNMMFKYEDIYSPLKPTKLCLIDFQLSKHGTLVMDLSYFFHACASEAIVENFHYYMKEIYYKSLETQLLNFGCDVNKLYPYSKFMEEWKKFGRYGLGLALIVGRIALAEDDEVPDFIQSAEGGDICEAFTLKPFKNEHVYNSKMKCLVQHMVREKIL